MPDVERGVQISVITLFPDVVVRALDLGLLGKAIRRGLVRVDALDPRTLTRDVHRTVDDSPFGGGGGMVLKPEPMVSAIERCRASGAAPVVLLSPQGRQLRQDDLARWAALGSLCLVAGRYEGFDERIRRYADDEISLGDFVLGGGEYASLAIIDGVARLQEGVLGNAGSAKMDSFQDGLLEHPQYTRPQGFRGEQVPEVLYSGNHARIAQWRHQQSLIRTRAKRPDLLVERGLGTEDQAFLKTVPSASCPLEVACGAWGEDVTPSFLEDFRSLLVAYGVRKLWLVGTPGSGGKHPASGVLSEAGAEDLDPPGEHPELLVQWVPNLSQLRRDSGARLVAGGRRGTAQAVGPRALVSRCAREGAALCLVLGVPDAGDGVDACLPSLRLSSRLSLMSAVAIYLDRLRGEA